MSIIHKYIFAFLCLLLALEGFGQAARSPYTSFGVGEPYGNALINNQGMAGVGVSQPQFWHINAQNPAMLVYNSIYTVFQAGIIAERRNISGDTLSETSQGGNMNYLVTAFPIKPSKWTTSLGHSDVDKGATLAEGLQKALAYDGSGGAISDDSLVSLYCAHAVTRWFLGFPEQALAAAKQGVAIAGRHPNPYLHVMVHGTAQGMLLEFVGDYPQLKTVATDILEQARRCGHVESQRWARVLLGVAQCRTGDPQTGMQTLQSVLDEMRERGLVTLPPGSALTAIRISSDSTLVPPVTASLTSGPS